MAKFLLLVAFLFVDCMNANVNGQGCDHHKCNEQIPHHYYELGCRPIYNGTTDCCPIRFECPKLENDGKCHVNGNVYNLNEKLSDSEEPLCSAACYCAKTIDGMKFRCASIECPEVFNGPKPECIYQSQFDRCCGKYECNRDKIEELTRTRCYLENKEYVKGQKMFSDKIGCYACICDEHFDNTTIINSANCQKVKCNIEIYYADRLMSGCVPVYYGTKYGKFNCCPIDWRCPDRKDEVIPAETAVQHNTIDDTQMTCKFGSLVLKIGDKIKSDKFCVDCSCSTPPMMHCVQNGHC